MASIRSQQATSSTSPCIYHVFLSFRGEDTRKTFTDHLYTALAYARFRTFRDDDGIERGENIKSALQKAIQESRISIVVLSKNYASSNWCLDELVMILKHRSTSGHVVLPVFYDTDPSQVRKQTGSVKEAFTRHEGKIEADQSGETKKEWMSKVEEWRAALREVADLAGMNLQNRADGHESRFIQKIVKVVGDKLSRAILDIAPYAIGIHSRAREIQFWLGDDSAGVGVAAICGMGGIGKTTMAKFLYNLNFSRFEGSSFLANVREISKEQDGLLCLQRQLLSDILKGRKEKIYNVDEGIVKIKDALCFKRVLVVLDDVDKLYQLEAVLGMRDWLFSGSKIIITTRHECLLRAHKVCKVHRIQQLDYDESIELFSLHAFGQSHPMDEYADYSKWVVNHCGGLPLAIKVLGSSLSGKSLEVWRSQLEKLKEIPDSGILERLKISYDCLQDDHDKSLFLHLACFFVGSNKDSTVTILDGCEFYTAVGIQNLMDRYLVRVDGNKIEMHHLLQEMGREIIRQESPKELGERSRLWNPKDSFNVLRQNTGTKKIEGLSLDMSLLKEDISATRVLGLNRKRSFEEFFENSLLSDVGNSLKRYCFGNFFLSSIGIAAVDSNQIVLETDAITKMHNLKLLQLGHVQVLGSYENFPKEIRWLCWHGFPFESIPSSFPLETLVALEIPHSSLKKFLHRTKFLPWLKILDLSHSYYLAKTPDFSGLPNLERLMLDNCASLNEVHESIGHLERLVLLNLKDCKNLRRLPRSIGMLKLLEKLDISGCSNLEQLPAEVRNMVSLKVLHANATSILSTIGDEKEIQSLIPSWIWKPKKSPETSWASFPRSLVKLSLRHCNLSEHAFPEDISSLSSLNFLDLSYNPIRSLPDCIKDLNGLQSLHVNNCNNLRRLVVVQNLNTSVIEGKYLLEKMIFPTASHRPKRIFYPGKINNLNEFRSSSNLQPIGNVNAQLLNHMGLSNLGSLGNPVVDLTATGQMRLPLQGCQEALIFSTFFRSSKVLPWFTFMSTGSLISFIVPSHLNSRIRGFSVCALYCRVLLNYESKVSSFVELFIDTHIIVSNTNTGLVWSHRPSVIGFPEAAEDMIWLSFWNFENQMETGDEMTISVIGGKLFQVKEVGVHIVYKEQEKKSTQSQATSEEGKESQQASPYEDILPGNAFADGLQLECCQMDCKYCRILCPQS